MVGAGHKSVNSWFEEKLLTHTAANMVIAGEDDEDFNDDAIAGPSRFIGVKFSPSHMPPVASPTGPQLFANVEICPSAMLHKSYGPLRSAPFLGCTKSVA
mgnify:CR=1 FL=1